MVREGYENFDNSQDYTADYKFNLVGNRLEKTTVKAGNAEKMESRFDKNDRLLSDRRILNGVKSEYTLYGYNGTEQMSKTVQTLLDGRIDSQTSMEYNDQGRLSKLTIHTYSGGVLVKEVVQEYEYDNSGIKVRQTETADIMSFS